MDACFYYVCNILTQPSKCHSRNGDSLSVLANCRLHFLFLAALNDAPCCPSAVARLLQGGFNMLCIQSGSLTINNTLLFSLFFFGPFPVTLGCVWKSHLIPSNWGFWNTQVACLTPTVSTLPSSESDRTPFFSIAMLLLTRSSSPCLHDWMCWVAASV